MLNTLLLIGKKQEAFLVKIYQKNWVAPPRLLRRNVFGALLKSLLQKQILTSEFVSIPGIKPYLIFKIRW